MIYIIIYIINNIYNNSKNNIYKIYDNISNK